MSICVLFYADRFRQKDTDLKWNEKDDENCDFTVDLIYWIVSSLGTYQLLKGAARLANSRCSRSICSSTRSASSSAWRRRCVSAPRRSHCEQMRWQRAFTLATSWYSRVLRRGRWLYCSYMDIGLILAQLQSANQSGLAFPAICPKYVSRSYEIISVKSFIHFFRDSCWLFRINVDLLINNVQNPQIFVVYQTCRAEQRKYLHKNFL